MAEIKLMWNEQCLGSVEYDAISHEDTKSSYLQINFSEWPTVNNCVRCYLKYDPAANRFEKHNKDAEVDPSTKIIRIAFIVESPHRYEFSDTFIPCVPLNGRAGKAFDNNICNKMGKWFQGNHNKTLYEIKIFNPVPYQTSLYHFLNDKIPYMKLSDQLKGNHSIPQYSKLNPKIRNAVWASLFFSEKACCKALFLRDIAQYQPDYIINCCTGVSINRISSAWESLQSKKGLLLKHLLISTDCCTLNMVIEDSLTELDNLLLQTIHYRVDYYPDYRQWK